MQIRAFGIVKGVVVMKMMRLSGVREGGGQVMIGASQRIQKLILKRILVHLIVMMVKGAVMMMVGRMQSALSARIVQTEKCLWSVGHRAGALGGAAERATHRVRKWPLRLLLKLLVKLWLFELFESAFERLPSR